MILPEVSGHDAWVIETVVSECEGKLQEAGHVRKHIYLYGLQSFSSSADHDDRDDDRVVDNLVMLKMI